jgi:hypothetical protein
LFFYLYFGVFLNYFMLLFGFGMTPETMHSIGRFVGVELPTSLAVALECASVYVAEN